MTEAQTAYEVVPQADGFYYRWPEGDPTANLVGPFPSIAAADAAVLIEIEKFIAASVIAAFGLPN